MVAEKREWNAIEAAELSKTALGQISYELSIYDMNCVSSIYVDILKNMKGKKGKANPVTGHEGP
jgi:hypothetical protein